MKTQAEQKQETRPVMVEKATAIVWQDDNGKEWAWGDIETHNPDGPFKVSECDDHESDDRWFIFAIVDSYFPSCYAVCECCFEDAYERFTEWQEDQLKIEEPDLADYDEDSLNYSPNGVPIDTENITGFEVRLKRVIVNK